MKLAFFALFKPNSTPNGGLDAGNDLFFSLFQKILVMFNTPDVVLIPPQQTAVLCQSKIANQKSKIPPHFP